MLQRQGPAYYQDPRFGMAVAAVAAGGYGSIYRDPFQPVSQPTSISCPFQMSKNVCHILPRLYFLAEQAIPIPHVMCSSILAGWI